MVPLSYYLLLSGFLFACGVAGFLIKRNIITIFMSIELMLNGVNLSFVAFAAHWHALSGQVFVFFVMVVAAAEAAVGLGNHNFGVPHARDAERGPGKPAQAMNPMLNLWLIPVLPLAGAAINGFLGKKSSRKAVTTIALFFSGAAFADGLVGGDAVFTSLTLPYHEYLAHWIRSGSFSVGLRFLSRSTFAGDVAGGDGSWISDSRLLRRLHGEDPSYYRFFSYLNLFMFFMLTLVLAGNYLVMFIGWEGVGWRRIC